MSESTAIARGSGGRPKGRIRVLALDPSASAIGFALMRAADRLLRAGTITPPKRLAKHPPLFRIDAMLAELLPEIDECKPDVIVVEIPAPQAPAYLRGKNAAGQATYGFAVGLVFAACRARGVQVDAVRSDVWTRGQSKEDRARWARRQFPEVVAARDRGNDMTDAIGLCQWWFANKRERGPQLSDLVGAHL